MTYFTKIDRDPRDGSRFAPAAALAKTLRALRPVILGGALALGAHVPANAVAQISSAAASPQIILAAQGCGPGWFRGPNGACHRFGHGPGPSWLYHGGGPYSRSNWYWGYRPACWQGYWGAWHCR